MKLLRFGASGSERPGILDTSGSIRSLEGIIQDVEGAALSDESLRRLRQLDLSELPKVEPSVRIGPCVAGTGKVMCIGQNYADHVAETGAKIPTEPVLFMKATSAITGPYDQVVIPRGSERTDWEVELAVVIGQPAKYVTEADALQYVAGYCVMNDISERTYQKERGGQWTKGKSCDTFAPLGPWLVTRDEVADPQDLRLWLEVDGERLQDSSTKEMIFVVRKLISYLSEFMTLEPGDIISTGTPPGVGLGQKPPRFLIPGQTLKLGVEGLGEQTLRTVASSVTEHHYSRDAKEMEPAESKHSPFGKTGMQIPRIVFGTSTFGNLYASVPYDVKLGIARQWFEHVDTPVVIDSAGKYGAGLSLESIGQTLRDLKISADQVIISNKLGWKRVPMKGPEPTFEPGAWFDIEHDAEQFISYQGIRECWEQGCELLGAEYAPALSSVHDPDEYLAAASSAEDRERRFDDIVEAYRALAELKQQGVTRAIGVGAKDWKVIQEIDRVIDLDWVMFANSLTVYRHPPELISFVESLHQKGVGIINSAVFHGGFMVGGEFFDYRLVTEETQADRDLLAWRAQFHELCGRHDVTPAVACLHYGLSFEGIDAVAVATSNPERIASQVADIHADVPKDFWLEAQQLGLMAKAEVS